MVLWGRRVDPQPSELKTLFPLRLRNRFLKLGNFSFLSRSPQTMPPVPKNSSPAPPLRKNSMMEKETRQQQERIFILGIAIISYVMDTCWLGLFYYYSVIKSEIPLSYGISTGVICTVFFLVIRSGWNLKL